MTPEQAAANAKPGLAKLVGAFAESPQTLRRARLLGLSGWAYHVSARAGALGDGCAGAPGRSSRCLNDGAFPVLCWMQGSWSISGRDSAGQGVVMRDKRC